MVEIVAFTPAHLAALTLQAAQASAQSLMSIEHGQQIVSHKGFARTAVVEGQPIACAGVIELWRGRGYAWSYLGDGWEKHAKAVHRAVVENLRASSLRRIEMAINPGHSAARRWAMHLGFDFEYVARKWTPDGRDMELWARVA